MSKENKNFEGKKVALLRKEKRVLCFPLFFCLSSRGHLRVGGGGGGEEEEKSSSRWGEESGRPRCVC